MLCSRAQWQPQITQITQIPRFRRNMRNVPERSGLIFSLNTGSDDDGGLCEFYMHL